MTNNKFKLKKPKCPKTKLIEIARFSNRNRKSPDESSSADPNLIYDYHRKAGQSRVWAVRRVARNSKVAPFREATRATLSDRRDFHVLHQLGSSLSDTVYRETFKKRARACVGSALYKYMNVCERSKPSLFVKRPL